MPRISKQLRAMRHSAAMCYPVGIIVEFAIDINPAIAFGFGSWERVLQGKVSVGLNASDADFDAVGKTGGAKTVTLTEAQIPAHTHTVTDPGHAHVENSNNTTTGGLRGWGAPDTSTNNSTATGYSTGSATTGITNQNTGGGTAHNNMPPYEVTCKWKRTA